METATMGFCGLELGFSLKASSYRSPIAPFKRPWRVPGLADLPGFVRRGVSHSSRLLIGTAGVGVGFRV